MVIKMLRWGPRALAVGGAILFIVTASTACNAAVATPGQPVSQSLVKPMLGHCPVYHSPAIQAHIKRAYELADDAPWSGMIPAFFVGLCAPAEVPLAHLRNSVVPPTKAFDQLYFVGNHLVGSFVLKTSAGLILFDTLDNSWEAEHILVAGLRELGLDPASIKYIVCTHGHVDHWGGARYLQEKYHAHVLLSQKDWALAYGTHHPKMFAGRPYPTPPKHDMNITDGEKLTLGDTTITLYITPGHTAGADSILIPVTDHGQPHLMAMFGGEGMPTYLTPDKCKPQRQAGISTYVASLQRWISLARAAGADGVLSTHPLVDGTDVYVDEIADNVHFSGSPWVLGKSQVVRYYDTQLQVAETVEAMEKEHPLPMPCQ